LVRNVRPCRQLELAGSGRSAGTVRPASVRLPRPVPFGCVREVKQCLGDGPGLGGGDLRAHVGALRGGPEVELDEGRAGLGVQRVRPGLQDCPDDGLGPVCHAQELVRGRHLDLDAVVVVAVVGVDHLIIGEVPALGAPWRAGAQRDGITIEWADDFHAGPSGQRGRVSSWSYLATSGTGRVSAGSGGSSVVRSRDRYTVGLLTLNRAAISATL